MERNGRPVSYSEDAINWDGTRKVTGELEIGEFMG